MVVQGRSAFIFNGGVYGTRTHRWRLCRRPRGGTRYRAALDLIVSRINIKLTQIPLHVQAWLTWTGDTSIKFGKTGLNRLNTGVVLLIVLSLAACDTQDQQVQSSASAANEETAQSQSQEPAGARAPEPEEGSSASALKPPPQIMRATFPDSEGKTFFNEQVLPKLTANGCQICHMPGAGYVRPEISYDGLFPFLAIGQAADNNIIMFKIANQRSFTPDQPNHPGGKRCKTEDADPCKAIKAWWEVEFGSEPL